MKKIAIVQSNYLPWKGYFDLMRSVDEFVLYDDMQFTRRDWRNRNKIKTPQGLQWLTVPVVTKGLYHQKILETRIDGSAWQADHWKALSQNYRRANHYEWAATQLEPLLMHPLPGMLSELNYVLLQAVCKMLGIETALRWSSEYHLSGEKSERLANLCVELRATHYVSGPAAQSYLDETCFADRKIGVEWFNYDGYPEYPQLWGEFTHHVSVVDLLFNCGPQAGEFLRRSALAPRRIDSG